MTPYIELTCPMPIQFILISNLQSERLLIVEGGGEVLLQRVGHRDVEVYSSVRTLMHGMINDDV